MIINKTTMGMELAALLNKVFKLPEVNKVQIRDVELFSADENDKIKKCVDECYHDILSDIDLGIHVTLHPEDIGCGQGYHNNHGRIGLTRKNYLGLSFSNDDDLFQLYRVIMKNGIRFDIGFYITEDSTAPIYHIPVAKSEEIKDEGKYLARWDLAKADSFWFVEIQAIAKLLRGDYLIADHLANMQINETLVAQMIERDDRYGTNFHRYGYHEVLDYRTESQSEYPFAIQDETYNAIATKIYSAAISYDRLVKRLNPEYEERSSVLFEIWEEYHNGINIKK